MSFDSAFIALEALIEREVSNVDEPTRNEAQTRFDLIDNVLKGVLNWPAEKIHVEEHVSDGYTDYEIRDVGTMAIVEAKSEGISFLLPLDSEAGACNLKPLIADRKNKALKTAMEQVLRYAGLRGVAPCLISNGHQWVVFLGSRNDGIAPLNGRGLVYPSLQSLRDNFVTFYNALSYDGLRSKKIFAELSIGTAAPPAPLAAALSNYPGIKRRNVMQSNLQIMGEVMLQDMPQEEAYADRFLEECYASSGALSSYAEISRELLTSRSAAVLRDLGAVEERASTKRGINPALSEEAMAAAASHRPIVLLGGVGAGKSTFIQHLVRVDAKTVFQDAIAILVDYGRGATFSSPADYAIEEIRRILLEDYSIDVDEAPFVEDIYKKDLEGFDRSVEGQLKGLDDREYTLRRIGFLRTKLANSSEHLKRSISRITRSHRRQVVIFLDNVDQRDHDDQNKVFLAANELAASWDATVFVTLRPETYYESQRYGAISGYHPRVFSIAPPRTDVMLQKRVDFALRVLEGGDDARTSSNGLTIESENLELFLRVLEHNFRRNRGLLSLIDNLAGGNMRRALGFVTQFIGSGHIDTQKIVDAELRSPGSYTIPLHEFLRSLMYVDNEYYDPQTSPVPNLFAIDRPEVRGHFLLPIALEYILSRGDATDSAGFVDVSDIYQHLQGCGFSLDGIAFALAYLARFRLIEAPLSDFDVSKADKTRITTVGAYTLRYLPGLFTYCDAVVVDTPILDEISRSNIGSVHSLKDRIKRIETFRGYLDSCWEAADFGSIGWAWPATSELVRKDMTAIAFRTGATLPAVAARGKPS